MVVAGCRAKILWADKSASLNLTLRNGDPIRYPVVGMQNYFVPCDQARQHLGDAFVASRHHGAGGIIAPPIAPMPGIC